MDMDIDTSMLGDLLDCMEKARAIKARTIEDRLERLVTRYLDGILAGMTTDGVLRGVSHAGHGAGGGGVAAVMPSPGTIIRPPSKASSSPVPVASPRAVPAPVHVPASPAPRPAGGDHPPAKDETTGPAMTVQDAVQSIVDRYNDEKVRPKFAGWENALVITLPDVEKSFRFMVHGADGIEVTEAADDNAAVQVTMDSDMFVRLLSKQVNPIKAYSSGWLKVKGEMKNMLKLRKLIF